VTIVVFDTYEIDDDKSRLDVAFVHEQLGRAYWSRGIPRDVVVRGIQNSRCFGVYEGAQQVGFARVITDLATFAYLSDVIVAESHRGRGIGKKLVQTIVELPELQTLRRVLLATADAQGLYAQFGFQHVPPGMFMEKKKENPYGAG
jgi:N-acetylglutamate synthase-like GNAT family acetyltransferase